MMYNILSDFERMIYAWIRVPGMHLLGEMAVTANQFVYFLFEFVLFSAFSFSYY